MAFRSSIRYFLRMGIVPSSSPSPGRRGSKSRLRTELNAMKKMTCLAIVMAVAVTAAQAPPAAAPPTAAQHRDIEKKLTELSTSVICSCGCEWAAVRTWPISFSIVTFDW